MAYTNNRNIPLSIAIWLARDLYDKDPNFISGSQLAMSNRQIILSQRVEPVEDLSDLVASRIGTAVNDAIDAAWKSKKLAEYIKLAGFNPLFEYVVNPEEPVPGKIAVYVQKRRNEPFMGKILSGAPDLIMDGRLFDYKSTSVFSYQKKISDDYMWQLTTYRYLFRDLIQDDTATIQFILRDWSKTKAAKDPEYPQTPCPTMLVRVGTADECRIRIEQRISEIESLRSVDEKDLPLCTDEELWLDPPKYAYYKNPTASPSARATRVFNTYSEAQAYMQSQNGIGRIDTRKGTPRACDYCKASSICSQRASLLGT